MITGAVSTGLKKAFDLVYHECFRVKQKYCSLKVGRTFAKSPNFCIQFYGKTLERVPKFSFLGVVLEENLSWKDHVEYVSSKFSRRLGLLSRTRSCLPLEAS